MDSLIYLQSMKTFENFVEMFRKLPEENFIINLNSLKGENAKNNSI